MRAYFTYQIRVKALGFFCFLLFLSAIPRESFAQKKKKQIINPEDTLGFHLPEELILGNAKYKTKHSYFLAGAGISGNGLKRLDGNFGIDYHFNIKGHYYQLGIMRSKELHGLFPVYYDRILFDFHASFGKKLESVKTTYMALIGPSVIIGTNNPKENSYTTAGIQGQVQAIYKVFFDVGTGICLYGNLNPKYSSAGIRLSFFFSNAYKGKVNEYLK